MSLLIHAKACSSHDLDGFCATARPAALLYVTLRARRGLDTGLALFCELFV